MQNDNIQIYVGLTEEERHLEPMIVLKVLRFDVRAAYREFARFVGRSLSTNCFSQNGERNPDGESHLQ